MRKLFSTALTIFILLSVSACNAGVPDNHVFTRADLSGKSVGVLDGTASPGYARLYEGEMSVNTFETPEAMAAELKSGGIDCAIADEDTYDAMRDYTSAVTKLDETYVDARYVLAVSAENRLMLENLNAALGRLRQSGELGRIASSWELGIGYENWAPPEGGRTITVAVTADFYPYAFYDENGELRGLEIDVVRALCTDLGLTPEFMAVEPDMLLYMAQSGKTSFSVGRITADPEKEGLSYTESYLHSTQLIVVRK